MENERFIPMECRGHMYNDEPARGSKLKLYSTKQLSGNSTPISSLCESLSSAALTTPVQKFSNVNEPMIMDCSSNLNEASVASPCQMPLNNQISNHIAVTDLTTPYNTPSNREIVNSTPRRNPRRSCSVKLTNFEDDFEDLEQEEVSQNATHTIVENILQQDSMLKISSDDINEVDKCFELLKPPKEKQISSNYIEQKKLPLPQDYVKCVNSSESKSCNNEDVQYPSSSVINNIIKSKTASEPRPRPRTRKSDVGLSSVQKLTFSAKRPSFKKKNIIEEYDPDNDIFAHGLVPTHFNYDSLREEIGKFLSCSDVPVTGLKRSKSCGALSNVNDTVETTTAQCSSPKKKQSRQVSRPPSKPPFKRTVSAPNLLETMSKESTKEVPKGGAVRAFLRARDIILNIQKRKKIILQPQASKTPSKVSNLKKCVEPTMINASTSFENDLAEVDETIQNTSIETNDSVSEYRLSDFSLPPTQPFESIILKDVTAYVEVISNNENISAGVRTELMKLGATVVPTFNRDVPVTHVVFNDGHISTYKKAKKRNIPLVSVLWIEECRKAGVKVHESLYPPYQIERYESPSIVKLLKKRKILHFPSDDRPRPSPRRKKGMPKSVLSSTDDLPEKELSLCRRSIAPKWVDKVAGDNGMMRILINMTGIGPGEFKDMVKRPPTPDSEIESNIDTPLAVRLLRKLAKTSELSCDENSQSEKQNESSQVTSPSQDFIRREMKGTEENSAPKNEDNVMLKDSVENPSPPCNSSTLMKNTQRQNTKRKLLTALDDTVSVSDDDTLCQVITNPHNCSPKHLSCDNQEKKRKLSYFPQENVQTQSDIKCTDKLQNDAKFSVRKSRRSSMYFVKSSKRTSSPVTEKPAIVCTLLHTVEVDVVASIIDKLGIYVLEKNVTAHTTHIVTGAVKRTVKVLKGMVQGCWIVHHEWVLKSLEAGKWLDEEEFEMTSFSPAVQKYRLEKLSFGAMFKPDIFRSCGPIFVSSKSPVPRGEIVELILLCGGHIVSRAGKAEIVVGKKQPGVLSVTALWVLDSITVYSCKPYDSYLCT